MKATPLIYIVSAFVKRRERIIERLKKFDQVPIFIESPAGNLVRESHPWLVAHPCWRDGPDPWLVTANEMACAAGHYDAWCAIEEEEEEFGIILEDDASIHEDPIPHAKKILDMKDRGSGRVLYLGWKSMAPPLKDLEPLEGTQPAEMLWWTCGYVVDRKAARILRKLYREMAETTGAIPVDEFIPSCYGAEVSENRLNLIHVPKPVVPIVGRKVYPPVVEQTSYEEGGSTTATKNFFARLETIVYATDREKAEKNISELEALGHSVTVLGEGEPGWDTAREGGRPKLEWLRKWLHQVDDPRQIVVLALDGYDTKSVGTPQDFLQRYGQMRSPIIVSGEKTYWPRRGLRSEILNQVREGLEYEPEYPYPCSGALIGAANILMSVLDVKLAEHDDEEDDQALIQFMLTDWPYAWLVDAQAEIFMSMSDAEDDISGDSNLRTSTKPLVFHENGPAGHRGPKGASLPLEIYHDGPMPIAISNSGIVMMPILLPDAADRLASILLAYKGWHSMEGDNVPGDELRLSEVPDLQEFVDLQEVLDQVIGAAVKINWSSNTWRGIKDLFAIRYSPDRQSNIEPHNDYSLISASIVLRKASAGGHLWFPRENVNDQLVESGTALIFPGRPSHTHQTTAVESGTRISLVVWSNE